MGHVKNTQQNKRIISKFTGLKTIIKDASELEQGTPQDALNWLTAPQGDHIELRGGSALLGSTRVSGVGKITGLKVGTRNDGVQIPFFTYLQKIKYYNPTTKDTVEVGTDILPVTANGEDMSIENYNSLAGSFIYIISPHSSFKICTANPTSAVNQSLDNKGYIKIKQNRSFLWNNFITSTGRWDKTGLTLSYIDFTDVSKYTAITGEAAGTGDGNQKTWTGQLAGRTGARTVFDLIIKGGGAVSTATLFAGGDGYVVNDIITLQSGDRNAQLKVTGIYSAGGYSHGIITTFTVQTAGTGYLVDAVAAISVSGGSGYGATFKISGVTQGATFTDDKNGNLVGTDGGTGTINYATGVYSVTFVNAPALSQAITANYLVDDATANGILDFSLSNNYFPQADGGGNFMNLFAIDDNLICLHALKSWKVNTAATITNTTNIPYRDNVNIPYWRAGDETDDGILAFFIGNQNFPKLAVLSYGQYTTTIVPTPLSDDMDFTPYGTDYPIVKRWGNYDLLCLQNKTNAVNDPANNIMFARNIQSGWFDKLDYGASVLDSYNGNLIAGDSISNNVFTLFSGYDDDGQSINNYWISDQDDLGIPGVKRVTYFHIDGFIAKDQNIDIYLQFDNGNFVKVGTISGQGNYVDISTGTVVGSQTVGMQVVGGGSVPNAYHFRHDFKINTPMFEYVTTEFKATDIGAVQINEYGFLDIRYKGERTIPQYNN